MANPHGPEISVTVTSTPTLVTPPVTTNPQRKYLLVINESAGPIFVTTDVAATTGPKVGTVAAADDGAPAGVFTVSQPVYLVAAASTAVKYATVLVPS